MAFAYDPNTRFAIGPSGYWTPVESGGRPLSDFVDVINANGQGSNFIPREELPADWQPGMAIQRAPNGSYVAVPFQPQGAVAPYDYHDYGSNTGTGPLLGGPETPMAPPPTDTGGLLGPAPGGTAPGGLPISQPVGTAPAPAPGGSLPVSMPSTGGGPVSMPNLPPIGAPNARDEIERLRQAGLLDRLSLSAPTNPLRAPDYGNGPGVPMTHDPGQQALFEYVRNNYFGTWDPRQARGGSNPYYNAPTSGASSLLPPVQGPIITGPGLLNP